MFDRKFLVPSEPVWHGSRRTFSHMVILRKDKSHFTSRVGRASCKRKLLGDDTRWSQAEAIICHMMSLKRSFSRKKGDEKRLCRIRDLCNTHSPSVYLETWNARTTVVFPDNFATSCGTTTTEYGSVYTRNT